MVRKEKKRADWRDVQAGSHHVVNGSDQALTGYGAYLMGEPIEDMLV